MNSTMNSKSILPIRWCADFTALGTACFALAIGWLLPAGAHAATIVATNNTDITLGTTWPGGAPVSGDGNLWQSKGSGAGSALIWPGAPTSFTFNGQTLEIVSGGSLTHGSASVTKYSVNNLTLDVGGTLKHGANSPWNLSFNANGTANTLQLNGGTISLGLATGGNIVLSNVVLNGSGTVTVTRTAASAGTIDFSSTTVDPHLFTGIFNVTGGGQAGVTKFNLPAITDANESFELDIADASSQWTNINNIAVTALKLWNSSSSHLDIIAAGSYTASSLGANYAGCFSLPGDSTHTIHVGHSLTYDANGGVNPPPTAWYNAANNPATLASVGSMTYSGNAFAGWNTAANGSGTAYAAGASLNILSNTTLYAQWTVLTGTITAPANFPAAISTAVGTASSSTSVSISGSGLTASILATAPTGLEVSSDGSNYGSTATFSTSGGTLYARLSASAALGAYNSLNVVLSSTGANPVNIATTASGNLVVNPYWAVASSGNWGTAANWFVNTIASGSGVTADFSEVDIPSDTTVHLDSNYTVGNLIFGNTDVAPAANWIVDDNGSAGANTLTLAGTSPTVTVNNLGTGKTATINAVIAGTAGLTKAGAGTLALSAGNLLTNNTRVATGTLELDNALALQNSTLDMNAADAGTLQFGSGITAATLGGLTGSRNITLANSASGAVNLSVGNNNTATSYTGSLSGPGGGLTKIGTGTFTLGADATLTGPVAVNSGYLVINGGNRLASASGIMIVSNAALQVTAAATYASVPATLNGNGVSSDATSAALNFRSTTISWPGAITLAGGAKIGSFGGACNTTLGGGILGTGPLTLSGRGGSPSSQTGVFMLNAQSAYSGATTFENNDGLSEAKFILGIDNALPATTTLTLRYVNNASTVGTTLDLNGHVQTLSGLAQSLPANGSGTKLRILNSTGTGALLISNNIDCAFGGVLGVSGLDSFSLTKSGNATLTLTNANTYTGNTIINAGDLQWGVGGSSANSTVILNASSATNGVSVTDNTQSWTCANLSAAAAGVLQFNFSAIPSATVAPLVVTGLANFSAATPKISVVGSIPAVVGAYPLMTWGSQSGTVPSAFIATPSVAMACSLSNSATTLYLVLAPIPVTSFPVVAAAPTNLIANGNFNQITDVVVGANATTFNINGTFGDYTAFWGSTANLLGWSPFAADPFGLTTNVVPFVNDPTKVLNGTYYLDTVVATNNGGITLNSSMSYLNGLIQTNVLNGVTIKSGATFLFMVDPNQAAGTANANSTFTAALTAGSGVNATNLATAVAGSLISVATTNLPTTAGPFLTNTINGASLLAAQGSGPVNVIFDQVNTTPIAGYPTSPNPTDITQVAQVRIHNAILRVIVPPNDLNHDGVVDQADVNLAQSYLDGSIDGGASATNRENLLINTYGFTTNQALAALNLKSFDINGDGYFDATDVTALQALVVTTPPTLNYTLVAPNKIQFNWSGFYKLQWLTNTLSVGLQTNVSNSWVDYPNTNNPVTVTNSQTIPSAFFRLSQ